MMKRFKIVILFLCISGLLSSALAQGQILWGPKTPPGQVRSGLYGICYNPTNDRIYYVNLYFPVIYMASSDSMVDSLGTIPTPYNDTAFVDIAYCNYDNTFWLISLKTKKVYKINQSGAVLRSFDSPATDYPCGLAWDEAKRTLYISERHQSPPQYIYAVDTMGNVLRKMQHPCNAYLGPRCLAYQPPTYGFPEILLNAYTFFTSGQALDSAGVVALDPTDCQVIDFFRYKDSNNRDNIRGVEYDPRDGSLWITHFQYG